MTMVEGAPAPSEGFKAKNPEDIQAALTEPEAHSHMGAREARVRQALNRDHDTKLAEIKPIRPEVGVGPNLDQGKEYNKDYFNNHAAEAERRFETAQKMLDEAKANPKITPAELTALQRTATKSYESMEHWGGLADKSNSGDDPDNSQDIIT